MKKRLKKIFNNKIFMFIFGGVLFSAVSVCAVTYFPSNQVTYDNSSSKLSSTNVQGAIDELYNICFPSSSPTISDLLPKYPEELYTDDYGNIRYYGRNPNNYVNFNGELWRIIGIINGKTKIIRNESIGNMVWDNSPSNNWNNSDLKNYLNVDYYNNIKEPYKSMISKETYYLGGPNYSNDDNLTAQGYYNAERDNAAVYKDNPISVEQYIGLMYASDYGYAAGEICSSIKLRDFDDRCYYYDYLFGGPNNSAEWLQNPYGLDDKSVDVIYGDGKSSGGGQGRYYSDKEFAVRPVLYLTSDTIIVDGAGTTRRPFKLGQE